MRVYSNVRMTYIERIIYKKNKDLREINIFNKNN